MMTKRYFPLIALSCFFITCSLSSLAQGHMDHMAAASHESTYNASFLFSLMELPFLFITLIFAFLTANALKGGKFGKGMNLVAWGFLVMAVGHLHMQIEHFYGVNIFKSLLGEMLGTVAWFVALVVTWGLSSLGFYSIYKTSKG